MSVAYICGAGDKCHAPRDGVQLLVGSETWLSEERPTESRVSRAWLRRGPRGTEEVIMVTSRRGARVKIGLRRRRDVRSFPRRAVANSHHTAQRRINVSK